MKSSYHKQAHEHIRAAHPRPGMEWVITGLCNYSCPYCCSTNREPYCADGVVHSGFDLLSELEGTWLVKLAGGEPMIHPRFLEVCEKTVKADHKLCMTTNFFLFTPFQT